MILVTVARFLSLIAKKVSFAKAISLAPALPVIVSLLSYTIQKVEPPKGLHLLWGLFCRDEGEHTQLSGSEDQLVVDHIIGDLHHGTVRKHQYQNGV